MDIPTLALAKQYTDSQRLGHTEEHKITWQGTVESYQNRVIHEEFGLKISDLTPAREALDGAKITFFSPGLDAESMTLSFPTENAVNETGVSLYSDDSGSIIVVLEMADGSAEPGVYWQSYAVIQTWLGSYIIVEYQTIHTIDPKYLPGVCLPVVEITSAAYPFMNDNIVNEATLSAEESAQFDTAVKESDFVIVKIRLIEGADIYSAILGCCNRVDGATAVLYSLGKDANMFFYGPDPETGLWGMGG